MTDVRFSYIVACSTCGRTTRMVYVAPLKTCVKLAVPRTWDHSGGEIACSRCLKTWTLEAALAEDAGDATL